MLSHNNSPNKIRNIWTILIWGVVVTLLLSSCGTQASKVYRVDILCGLDLFTDTADGFKAKMTELGYIEGQNIVYEVQKTNFEPSVEQRILQKFVDDKVDLIFVFPTEISLAAKAATQETNIPVVFAHAGLEGTNLVNSIREPGGNITGVRYPGLDFAVKRLEILLQLAPQAKRIWVPDQRNYPIVPGEREALRRVAAFSGVTLVEVPADSPADIQADLQARAKLADIGLDAILTIPEPLASHPDVRAAMGKFATEHNVPIGGTPFLLGEYGTVFGLGINSVEVGKQAAVLADKIFKGIPVGTIPVVPGKGHLQINNKMAQKMGLTVPEGLLKQADEVIR
jgi:putative ABC transport system substrate-binding protein